MARRSNGGNEGFGKLNSSRMRGKNLPIAERTAPVCKQGGLRTKRGNGHWTGLTVMTTIAPANSNHIAIMHEKKL